MHFAKNKYGSIMQKIPGPGLSFLAIVAGLIILPATAFAQYSSSNYQSNEVFFGSGGDLQSSSPSYQAQSSVGALGVGSFSSSAYQTFVGFLTPNEPFLEMSIDTALVNLGNLDAACTKTGTASFHG